MNYINNIIVLVFILILLYLLLNRHRDNFDNNLTNSFDVFFIHIPKTAGTSFKKTYNIPKCHHYDSYPRKNKINIAVIRNPYNRFLSIFKHLKDRTNKLSNLKENDVCNDLLEYDNIYDFTNSYFDKTHKYHLKTKKLLTWKKSDFDKLKSYGDKHVYGCVKDYKCIHWAPQSFYVENPKDVQYLLRFENLNSDLDKLHHLGVLPTKNINHINSTDSKKIKMNDKIKKLVDIVYKDDFELWNQSGL